MAVTISVLSTFSDAGLKKAQAEMGKLNKKVQGGLSAATKTAGAMSAGVLGAAGVAIGGLISIGTTFDSVYDSMRVNTGKTGAELEALKGSLKIVASNAATSFDDAGTVLSTFTSKLGLTGKPLEDMSIAIINLSNITNTDLGSNLDSVTKVMQNFGVMAQYQVPALDMLYRASQQSGIKVSELAASMAESGPMLRQAGFDYADAAAFIAQLSKAGIDASDVMPTLGKAVGAAGKKGISAGKYLDDAFTKIRNAPNDVAAASDAVTLFGTKGAKMAELIRSGAVSFDDFKKSISEGDTIAAATTDTEDFGEKFTKLKNRIMLALEPFATKAFEIIGDVFDKIGPKVDQVTKFFQENEWALTALQIGLGAIIVACTILTGVMIALAIAELGVTWPLVLVIAIIALVVAAVIYMWVKFDWFRNGVMFVVNALVTYWKFMFNVYKTIFTAIINIIKNTIIPFFTNTLIPIFISIWDTAKTVWNAISAVIDFAWNFIILPVLRDLKLFFDNVLMPIFEQLWSVIKTVWDLISAAISFAWNSIIKPVFDLIVGGVQWVIDKFFTVKDAIGSAFSTVANAIQTPFKAAFNFIVDAWNGTVGGLGFTAPDWLKYIPGAAWFAGKSITIPKLEHWAHEGGIVGGAPGANVPMMLQTGEMVLSQDQQAMLLGRMNGGGGGGNTYAINVNVSPTADKASVGQAVVESIREFERRSGSSWRAA